MANMGSTGTVKVEAAMIVNAIAAINTYQTTINSINTSLKNEIDNLIPSSFSGSAADGYKVFFENSIYPNITTNLTKMLESLKSICESIKKNIPETSEGVDDQLGEGNKSAGNAAQAGNVAQPVTAN